MSETTAGGEFLGWRLPSVAQLQHAAYQPLLEAMRRGQARDDLAVAIRAIESTGLQNPELLEVGCGSAYYSEIIGYMLPGTVRYVGLDSSAAMISLARSQYASLPILVGDAVRLPFLDSAFEIVMNGVSLMHIVDYQSAIAESARVARNWCIFHTVPTVRGRPTVFLQKRAYGGPTIEVIFNEADLLEQFACSGLAVRATYRSIPYDLSCVIDSPTQSTTYVCERVVE